MYCADAAMRRGSHAARRLVHAYTARIGSLAGTTRTFYLRLCEMTPHVAGSQPWLAAHARGVPEQLAKAQYKCDVRLSVRVISKNSGFDYTHILSQRDGTRSIRVQFESDEAQC
jgi:hypothetical protein